MSSNSWPKQNRIRKTRDYQRIQSLGKRWRTRNLIALYVRSSLNESRVGMTVSKKVGNAVQRNRVKRMIREGIRKEYSLLKMSWDIVLIARSSALSSTTENIQYQIKSIFQNLSRKS